MSLTIEEILAADDRPIQRLFVPEWGGEVCLRAMTGAERDAFEAATVTMRGKNPVTNLKNFRARLSLATICDDNGERLTNGAEQVMALGDKSCAPLDRIVEYSQRLNRIGEQDVEELTGNSETGQLDDSGSA